MKRLLLIPTTVVTAFLAFAFLQPGTAGGVLRAVAPTVLSALPSAVLADGSTQSSSANGRLVSSQGSAQSTRSTGALSNPSDPLVNPETKDTTQHAVSTAAHTNCGRFGGGFHGGKHLFVCPNHPFPPPANQ